MKLPRKRQLFKSLRVRPPDEVGRGLKPDADERGVGRLRVRPADEVGQGASAARRLSAYPHELSGGLRQQAMIAMTLSCRTSLRLADEPTTALDATVQIQVLILLRQLPEELGMG